MSGCSLLPRPARARAAASSSGRVSPRWPSKWPLVGATRLEVAELEVLRECGRVDRAGLRHVERHGARGHGRVAGARGGRPDQGSEQRRAFATMRDAAHRATECTPKSSANTCSSASSRAAAWPASCWRRCAGRRRIREEARGEADPRRARVRRRLRAPLRRGGEDDRRPRAPEHRAGLRARGGARDVLPRDGARRGRERSPSSFATPGGSSAEPLTPEEGAYVGVEVCRALDYAHRRMNVVHRDVTPRNVMVDEEGQVKVIDFGIAAPVATAPSGQGVFGSPGHMPPEQMARQRADARGRRLRRRGAADGALERQGAVPPARRPRRSRRRMRAPHPKPSDADIRALAARRRDSRARCRSTQGAPAERRRPRRARCGSSLRGRPRRRRPRARRTRPERCACARRRPRADEARSCSARRRGRPRRSSGRRRSRPARKWQARRRLAPERACPPRRRRSRRWPRARSRAARGARGRQGGGGGVGGGGGGGRGGRGGVRGGRGEGLRPRPRPSPAARDLDPDPDRRPRDPRTAPADPATPPPDPARDPARRPRPRPAPPPPTPTPDAPPTSPTLPSSPSSATTLQVSVDGAPRGRCPVRRHPRPRPPRHPLLLHRDRRVQGQRPSFCARATA